MARERDDRRDDRKRKRKPDDDKPQRRTVTEDLKAKSTQSGPEAMAAVPGSMAEATDAAVYSTGPGAVVAYDYQRTGTYADEYAAQQAVSVEGTPVPGGMANNPT